MNRLQLVVLASLLLAPLRASAADITINVSAAYIEESITAALVEFLENGRTDFGIPGNAQLVQVTASRSSDTAIRFTINLSFVSNEFPLPVAVTLEADIALNCDADGPTIELTAVAVNTIVPVPPEQEEEIRAQAQMMLAARAQRFIDPIWDRLDGIPGASEDHGVCPRVEVGTNGSLLVELDFVNGCINGNSRRLTCGIGWIEQRCHNGEWAFESMNCH